MALMRIMNGMSAGSLDKRSAHYDYRTYNCITQKDTQPSQTCSEGYIFLLLFATVVFLCIVGEY